jgi:hypothetical protein
LSSPVIVAGGKSQVSLPSPEPRVRGRARGGLDPLLPSVSPTPPHHAGRDKPRQKHNVN